MRRISDGIFEERGKLFTNSIAGKARVYDEKFVHKGRDVYRTWDAKKSKLAAAIRKGLQNIPIKKGSKVLYLGAAYGTTASHVADIVGNSGVVYSIDFSARSTRGLLNVAKKRKNMVPIMADARLPGTFAPLVEKVDIVYQDVAQRDQAEILKRNADAFLKKDGWVMIAIKARAISSTTNPTKVFKEARVKLASWLDIKDERRLEPFEKDHAFFVGKRK